VGISEVRLIIFTMKTIQLSVVFAILLFGIAAFIPAHVSDSGFQTNIISAFGGGGGEGGGGGGEGGGGGCGGCDSDPDPDPQPDPEPEPEGPNFGCTDPLASNHDPLAASDDGSCVYPTPTCDAFSIAESVVMLGDNMTFSWGTTNVTAVSFNNGIGGVAVDGTNQTFAAPTTVGTYTYTLTFDGQTDASCVETVVVEEPATPAPKCLTFEANPSTLTKGDSTNLNWTVENAVRVVIDNAIGEVTGTSFGPVTPLANTVYKLTVFGANNTQVSCEAPVTVNPVVVNDTPNISIIKRDAADKDDTQQVTVGGVATFEIVVTNTGDEDLVNVTVTDPIEASCEKTVGALAIGASDTYTCTTTNVTAAFTNTAFVTGDSAVDGETVTDNDPTQVTVVTVGNTLPLCNAFTAAPGVLPVGGGAVVLDWELFNTATAVIDNGIGDVTIGNGTIDGTMVGSRTETVTQSTTFTLTATDVDGESVSCIAPVAVADPAIFTCADNVTFSASDTSITSGSATVLTWVVSGADSVSISDIGTVAASDSQSVSPTSDTTYTLTATQAGFTSLSCPLPISVSTGGGGGGGSSSPRCELEISDTKINRGEEVTLTWETQSATEVTLTDDRDFVLLSTDDLLSSAKRDLLDSELTVTPTRDTTYTLLAERGSKDRTCTVDVEIENDVVLLQVRDQAPLVAGISLTAVPYTGFEAGPTMTVLFYMLLVLWALYITYVLVIPKTMLAAKPVLVTPQNTTDLMKKSESVRPDVFAPLPTNSVVASTVAAPVNLPTAATYEAPVAVVPTVTNSVTALENQAHAYQALLSSGAVQELIEMTTEENRSEMLKKIVSDAKGVYPLEDGWVVINQSRLTELTTKTATPLAVVTGNGSLAEAIVTGNVVSAYEMIGDRPMIALADAAADLDAVYRNRKGATESVSDMLSTESAKLTDGQVTDMIAALTGALDGTYTDEASAVKMAIMKAVKAAA
jgi:uncharacterized repeat protein (TIGR01451 family)